MIKERSSSRKTGMLATKLKGLMSIPAAFFRPRAWNHLGSSAKNWLSFLDNKKQAPGSHLNSDYRRLRSQPRLWQLSQKTAEANTERLNNLVADIESRQDSVDAFILYNNEAGARTSLEEISRLLASLPQKKTAEIETYQRLAKRYQEQADKIQKITHVSQPEKISDLAGLNATNLIFADKKLYAAAGATIHAIDPKVSGTSPINPNGATALEQPYYDEGSLYYLNSNQLLKMSIKDNASSLFNIPMKPAPALKATVYSITSSTLSHRSITKYILLPLKIKGMALKLLG
jgi:hypothetical protein